MQETGLLLFGKARLQKAYSIPIAIVPLKWIEYGVYGDLIITHPKPYPIHLIKADYKKWQEGTSEAAKITQISSNADNWLAKHSAPRT